MGITSTTRQLRRTLTDAERMVWTLVRNRKLRNFKFLRQHPFLNTNPELEVIFFVVDFYCAELKLALEIDGTMHNDQAEYDTLRTKTLNEIGILVVRISNEKVLGEDFDQFKLWNIIEQNFNL